ncbi:M67 family metallopeptidase [Paenibacillus sp.]|uniref:M67 family metallopeptidase n=1 Tax=Paenibacillus sp. TaxID=58172 RepID=UPI003561FEDA
MPPESITLTSAVWQKMIEHCREAYPLEACGLLFGGDSTQSESLVSPIIDEFLPIANVASDPGHRFRMHPQQLIRALTRGSGEHPAGTRRALLGIVHSHPKAPPVPSSLDLDPLWNGIASYWIVSLSDLESPAVRAYTITCGGDKKPVSLPLVFRVGDNGP